MVTRPSHGPRQRLLLAHGPRTSGLSIAEEHRRDNGAAGAMETPAPFGEEGVLRPPEVTVRAWSAGSSGAGSCGGRPGRSSGGPAGRTGSGWTGLRWTGPVWTGPGQAGAMRAPLGRLPLRPWPRNSKPTTISYNQARRKEPVGLLGRGLPRPGRNLRLARLDGRGSEGAIGSRPPGEQPAGRSVASQATVTLDAPGSRRGSWRRRRSGTHRRHPARRRALTIGWAAGGSPWTRTTPDSLASTGRTARGGMR